MTVRVCMCVNVRVCVCIGVCTLFFIRIRFSRIVDARMPKNEEYLKNQAEARFSTTHRLILLKLPNFSIFLLLFL